MLERPEDPPVPRNLTALMQHLQMLVGVCRHQYWCGGAIPIDRFPAFASKMADRYPSIGRNARQRSYDRRRGRASVRMVVYPLAAIPRHPVPHRTSATTSGIVAWWLVSTEGSGGLGDERMPDHRVSADAMLSDSHIEVGDYLLAYVSKLVRRGVIDRRTGVVRPSWQPKSTWTWTLREPVRAEVRAAIVECCKSGRLGRTGDDAGAGFGLLGLLAAQRARPLFSGVRNDVIEFHRLAVDSWNGAGIGTASSSAGGAAERVGPPPLRQIIATELPLMRRIRIFEEQPELISQAVGAQSTRS